MPEHADVETDKLQDQIAEAHAEAAGERSAAWLRYVGLSAALFAVVAAVAALRSGDLINEATIDQIKASDTWTEYQAAREKEHTYAIALDDAVDRGSKNAARMRAYRDEISSETAKEHPLQTAARKLEEETAADVSRHHAFEYAVALLQVGIALGAVGALARSKPAWYVSLGAGATGVFFFLRGLSQ
jgi:hypothetical protein